MQDVNMCIKRRVRHNAHLGRLGVAQQILPRTPCAHDASARLDVRQGTHDAQASLYVRDGQDLLDLGADRSFACQCSLACAQCSRPEQNGKDMRQTQREGVWLGIGLHAEQR